MVATFRKSDLLSGQELVQPKEREKIVIAVDGPSASGKGTLAKKLAERLGYAYLDTGALYRAVGFATLEMGGNPADVADVTPALSIVLRNLTPELLSNAALRTAAVADAASKVAALPEVRLELLDFQRDFAANPPGKVGGAVLDGRDIGTIVCPDADVKFFVTAKVEERARRRLAELKDNGSALTLAQVVADLEARDRRDAERAMAPTRVANDAYVLDTTILSAPQVVEDAIAVIRSKFLELTDDGVVV